MRQQHEAINLEIAEKFLAEHKKLSDDYISIMRTLVQEIDEWSNEQKSVKEELFEQKNAINDMEDELIQLNPYEYDKPDDLKTLLTVINMLAAEPQNDRMLMLKDYLSLRPDLVDCILKNTEILNATAKKLFAAAATNVFCAIKLIPSYLCPKINLPADKKGKTSRDVLKKLLTSFLKIQPCLTLEAMNEIERIMTSTPKNTRQKRMPPFHWLTTESATTPAPQQPEKTLGMS